jgi:multiple sugar transport system substrate-binding protein
MKTTRRDIPLHTRLSRRRFLGTAARASAGIGGMLRAKTPPAFPAQRTLSVLTWSHFIKASDDHLLYLAQAFGKAQRCEVKIDFIPHRDTYIKVAKEQQTRKGHDIVFLFFSMPQIHHEDLETLDFMDTLGHKLGGWYDLTRDVGQVQGRWVALPWFCTAMPMTYREDLYQQHGFSPPQTWETWKETARRIKEASGHKVGVALNQTEDSNLTLSALL